MSSSTFNAEKYINKTVLELPPSGIRKFFDLASGSDDIISLGVGEPDFVTPKVAIDAAIRSLEEGMTMYSSNHGTPELRKEIVKYLYNRFGLEYDEASEVVVTVGGSEAIDIILRALLSPGDEILIPEPCFVAYQACAALAGGTPVAIPLKMENEFQLTAEELETYITPKSKVLLINYPCNPTGAVMTEKELKAVAKVAIEHDLIVISDEIYAELIYDGLEPVSMASIPGMKERTILVSGMSKAFAMTGWRVGYVTAHKDFIDPIVKLHQYAIMCAPTMGQIAAEAALQKAGDSVVQMREEYDRRRRFFVERMKEIGLPMVTPRGAFYAFPCVKNTGLSSEEFATRLLKEYNVAAVPGDAFGESGSGFLRCSYATSMDKIAEALNRMEKFVQSL